MSTIRERRIEAGEEAEVLNREKKGVEGLDGGRYTGVIH